MQMFEEIDSRRDASGLTRKQVYERAGVHKETWRRLAAGAKPTVTTLEKLNMALNELIREKEHADV